MKLSKARIDQMAGTIIQRLQEQHYVELQGAPSKVSSVITQAIHEELSVEDRLNQEIRTLLKQYDTEFEKGRADYQKMFSMVKEKLVRERGLVL